MSDILRNDRDVQCTLPNVYSELLQSACGGHALWAPRRTVGGGGALGDVGYIQHGSFYKVFNAFENPPQNIPRLDIPADGMCRDEHFHMSIMQSSTSSTVSFHVNGSATPVSLPLTTISVEPRFSLEQEHLAFLAPPTPTVRDTVSPAWLAAIYDWVGVNGDKLDSKKLVVLTHVVRSSGWVGGVVTGRNAKASLGVSGAFGGADAGAIASVKYEVARVALTQGPRSAEWSPVEPEYSLVVRFTAFRTRFQRRMDRLKFALSLGNRRQSEKTSGHPSSSLSNTTPNDRGSSAHGCGSMGAEMQDDYSSAPEQDDGRIDDDAFDEEDPERDCNLLDGLLDMVLDDNKEVDVAVADWSIINDFADTYPDMTFAYRHLVRPTFTLKMVPSENGELATVAYVTSLLVLPRTDQNILPHQDHISQLTTISDDREDAESGGTSSDCDETSAVEHDLAHFQRLACSPSHGIKQRSPREAPTSKFDECAEHASLQNVNSPRGRNLVVCIDGCPTNWKYSNVSATYRQLVKDPETQLTFFSRGLLIEAQPSLPSWSYLKKAMGHKLGLTSAWNFESIILSAYEWLTENYRKGDRIFLFGFSHGAYQVRVLSAMINTVGLLHRGNVDQIPFAYQLYAMADKIGPSEKSRHPRESYSNAQIYTTVDKIDPAENSGHPRESYSDSALARFKATFSQKDVKVHFVGAWDTVSSAGPRQPLPGTSNGMGHVCYFRHALALHERRVNFLPEYANGHLGPRADEGRSDEGRSDEGRSDERSDKLHTKEVWFAGCHDDLGGGPPRDTFPERFGPALRWMINEASIAGLLVVELASLLDDVVSTLQRETSPSRLQSLLRALPQPRIYRAPRTIRAGQLIHTSARACRTRDCAVAADNLSWDTLLDDRHAERTPSRMDTVRDDPPDTSERKPCVSGAERKHSSSI